MKQLCHFFVAYYVKLDARFGVSFFCHKKSMRVFALTVKTKSSTKYNHQHNWHGYVD